MTKPRKRTTPGESLAASESVPAVAGAPGANHASWGLLAAVPLVAALAFVTSLRGGFVWDDTAFLPLAPAMRAVGNPLVLFESSLWRFTLAESDVPIYRPVMALTLWGLGPVLGDAPLPWHVFAVALHGLASGLVAWLIFRLLPGRNVFAAAVGGLLFAVHPVHTEAVAFVLAFNHPLAAIFAVAAAHAQLSHSRGRSAGWLLAAGVASALAMMTNEIGLAVPFLLLFVEWTQLRRVRPAVIAAAIVPLVVVLVMRSRALTASVPIEVNGASIATAFSFVVAYLQHLLVPWPQHVWITVPRGGLVGPVSWVVAAGVVLATTLVLLRTPRGERALPLLGAGWMALSIAPLVLAALNPTPLFAPRGLYLPSVGLALLVAWVLRDRDSSAARLAVGAMTVIALIACNVLALGWRDERTVLARMLDADPESGGAHLALAKLEAGQGSQREATSHFESAVAYARTQDERLNALEPFAAYVSQAGDLPKAEELWREIVTIDPAFARGWRNLGMSLALQDELEPARDAYRRATELDPNDGDAWWNLSLILDALHDPTDAAEARRRSEALGGAP